MLNRLTPAYCTWPEELAGVVVVEPPTVVGEETGVVVLLGAAVVDGFGLEPDPDPEPGKH